MEKKHLIPILSIVILTLFIFAIILRILTPQSITVKESPQLSTNYDNTHTQFQNVRYSGTMPQVPESFYIDATEVSGVTPELIKNQLISKYSLTPGKYVSDSWESNEYFLYQTPIDKSVVLGRNVPPTPKLTSIDRKTAIQSATTILNQVFPNQQLQMIDNYIIFIGGGTSSTISTPDKAQMVRVPFSYTIDGYPVYYQNKINFPFEIIINIDYGLQKLTFFPEFFTFAHLRKEKSIPVEHAIQNINRGFGTIVNADQPEKDTIDVQQITSANLTSVSIEYRVNDELHVALPFYHFSGTAQNSLGSTLSVDVITPAIATTP